MSRSGAWRAGTGIDSGAGTMGLDAIDTGRLAPPRDPVLVTGGAGYIGRYVVNRLAAAGEHVVVVDRHDEAAAAPAAAYERCDVRETLRLASIFRHHRVAAVMHLAALNGGDGSLADASRTYRNNANGTHSVLRCAAENGVGHVLLASTAAVYGAVQSGVCRESSTARAITAYGHSKWLAEGIVRNTGAASGLRHVILRLFNVAGASPGGGHTPGSSPLPDGAQAPAALVKAVCEVAVGARGAVPIHGTDYATPDGTCVRDYVHVEDVAEAHVLALAYLRAGGDSVTLNCGTGRGHSVRDVIRAGERAAGCALPVAPGPRRSGDVAVAVAQVERIGRVLGWSAARSDLDVIVASALAAERVGRAGAGTSPGNATDSAQARLQ